MEGQGSADPPDNGVGPIDPNLSQLYPSQHAQDELVVALGQLQTDPPRTPDRNESSGEPITISDNDLSSDDSQSEDENLNRKRASTAAMRKQRQRERALRVQEEEEAELRQATIQPDWLNASDYIGDALDVNNKIDQPVEGPGIGEQVEEYHPVTAKNDRSAPLPSRPPPDDPNLVYKDSNIYRNGKKLAEILGSWGSQKDLDNFLLQDPDFVNWFQPYNMYLKKPRSEDEAKEQTSMAMVLSRFRIGEANSKRRFSKPDEKDMATWKEPELLARLLYMLRDNLVDTASGTFFGLDWSEGVIHQRLWFMMMRAKYLRRDKVPNEKEPDTHKHMIMPRVRAISTISAQLVKRVKQKLAPKVQLAKQHAADSSRIARQRQREWDKSAIRDEEQIVALLDEDECNALFELSEDAWNEMMEEVEDEEWLEFAEANSSHVSSGSFQKRIVMTPETSAAINAEVLEEAGVENGIVPRFIPRVSPKQRFWQLYTIISALSGVQPKDVSDIGNIVASFAARLASGAVKSKDAENMVPVNANLAADAQARAEANPNARTTGKSGGTMDYDLVPLTTFQADASLAKVSELLAKKRYERTNFAAACKYLRIDPRAHGGRIRPSLTNRTFNAYWWQITGAWNLLKMFDAQLCRGGILADLVGLGKTFILGIVMLYMLEQRMRSFHREINHPPEHAVMDDDTRNALVSTYSLKPFLVVVPNHLMTQWIDELRRLSKFFYICIYHQEGEALLKRKGNIKRVWAYGGTMTKSNAHLKPSLYAVKIVLTTPETFASRHGPQKLNLVRREKMRASREGTNRPYDDPFTKDEEVELQRDFTDPDRSWKYDLHNCFAGVLVDEATCLKSEQAMANIALRWLNAPFVALATATPVQSSHQNISGYLAMLELPGNEEALRALPNLDPYIVQSDGNLRSEAQRACLSSAAWEKYVTDNRLLPEKMRSIHSVADAGMRLLTVFKMNLVRRTYSSYIPGSKETTAIYRALPDCYRYSLDTEMSGPQKLMFDAASARHFRRLVMPNERVLLGRNAGTVEKHFVKNSNAQRALVGLGLCALLGFVGIPTSHKSITQKEQEKYIEARLYANCILKAAHERAMVKKKHKANVSDSDDEVTAHPASVPEDDEPFEPFWYREGEFNFFEIDNVKWMKWYIDRCPENAKYDPYIHLLLRIIKQIRKHTDKGPKGENVCGANIVTEEPNADTIHGRNVMLHLFLDWSPRLRTLFGIITGCIARKEKAVLWVLYPFEQILLVALLRLVGASSEAFLAEMSASARSHLGTRFNTKITDVHDDDNLQFLVCSYAVGGVGLNLQSQCHIVIMVDHPLTHAIGDQALGRCFRLGQIWDVHCMQLSIRDTFDVTLANANERRMLALLFANLDEEALVEQYHAEYQAVEDGDTLMEDVADNGKVNKGKAKMGDAPTGAPTGAPALDKYFEYKGKLIHDSCLTDSQRPNATPLSAYSVLCLLYTRLVGARVNVRDIMSEDIGTEELTEEELIEYMRRIPKAVAPDIEDYSDTETKSDGVKAVKIASSPAVPASWTPRKDQPTFGTKRSRDFAASDVTVVRPTRPESTRSVTRRPKAMPMFGSSPPEIPGPSRLTSTSGVRSTFFMGETSRNPPPKSSGLPPEFSSSPPEFSSPTPRPPRGGSGKIPKSSTMSAPGLGQGETSGSSTGPPADTGAISDSDSPPADTGIGPYVSPTNFPSNVDPPRQASEINKWTQAKCAQYYANLIASGYNGHAANALPAKVTSTKNTRGSRSFLNLIISEEWKARRAHDVKVKNHRAKAKRDQQQAAAKAARSTSKGTK